MPTDTSKVKEQPSSPTKEEAEEHHPAAADAAAEEENEKPSASPDPEDDERYMMFRHYDKGDNEGGENKDSSGSNTNEEDPSTHHVIPKSPAVQRSFSMRGRGPAGVVHHPHHHPPTPHGYYYPHPPPPGYAGEYPHYGASAGPPITPGSPHKSSSYYMYPPSSPIKASNSIDLTKDEEQEDGDEEMGEEWMPPPSSRRKAPPPSEERRVAVASSHSDGGREGPPPPHYYHHQPPTPRSYYPYGPSLSSRSKSMDSSESPYQLPPGGGGRVQLVGAGHEWDGLHRTASWSLVSRSRSIESGGSSELYEPPRPSRNPMAPTPGRPPVSGEPLPPSPYAAYPPPGSVGTPERPPYGYDYPYGGGGRYAHHPSYPPHPYYPPPSHHEEAAVDLSHPLLKDYNPHADGIRPQFTNFKKTPKRPVAAAPVGRSMSPQRKRRRRNPDEKAAAAAAMAAAAKAAAEKEAESKGDDETSPLNGSESISTKELKTLGSGDDEDIPAAKRAAMASAVALRAAAAGTELPPPKAAKEVDFDIVQPPLLPIVPAGVRPVLRNTSMMGENDVLCGRGGGTNSQMGNRRFRALVRDFQPTYLMAKRRDKPLMARSVVLIVRHRGGRFLIRDDADGRLYEVGDEKAEAKTSQALREGLDVRATKSAANTLMGGDPSKKRKASPSDGKDRMAVSNASGEMAKKPKPAQVKFPQPRLMPSYMHHGPPPPPHFHYYRGHPPPPGYNRVPPPGSMPPSYPPPYYRGGYPPSYPGYPPARPGPAPIVSPPRKVMKKTEPKPSTQTAAS